MAIAERKPLGQLLRRSPRYGINAAAVTLKPGIATYIRITDIDGSGRFAPDPKVGVAHPNATGYRLAPGELVFARTGASVGKSYLYDQRDGELVYAGFLINIAPDPNRLNPKYLSLFAHTKEYWDWIARTSARSGQPGVNGREYAQLPIPLPDIATQNAIADAMTDVDSLIVTLEQLITKKQAIKRGMMQRFLIRQTDKAAMISLGSITSWLSGGTPDRSNLSYWCGTIPWISATTLKNFEVATSDQHVTPVAVKAGSRMAPLGSTLLLVRGSALHSEIRASLVTGPVCFNQDVKALVPSQDIVPKFLTYSIHGNADSLLRLVTSAGNTAGVLDTNVVKRFEIYVPKRSEQQRITLVLDDLSNEIDLLKLRLLKAEAVKQGMIRELLSGRRRLQVVEAS
jgi:type I restriction enzyme, S subunit